MAGTLLLGCTKPDIQDDLVRVPNGDRFSRTYRVINSGSQPIAAGTAEYSLLTLTAGSRSDFIVGPGQDLIIDVVGNDRAGASVHVAHIGQV